MIFRDTVTIRRASVVAGPYNSTERNWSAATSTSSAADVQPLQTTEQIVGQDSVVTRWRIYLPAGADLVYTDRVDWDGSTFEVDGEVERWKRRGVLHHLEAVLKRVQGA